jgi:hypothetical protein
MAAHTDKTMQGDKMSKCSGFERDGHVVNVRLQAGDVVRFKHAAPAQSAVEVLRAGVAAQRERLLEQAALSEATSALRDTRPVQMGLHEESFGELFGRWCKKIIG